MTLSVKPNLQLIYVSNIERSTALYKTLFNVEPVFSSPRYVAFAADDSGEALFALWTGGVTPQPTDAQYSEIGIMMSCNEDVDTLFNEWRTNSDISVVQAPYTEAFGLTFVVKDPDGHIIRAAPRD